MFERFTERVRSLFTNRNELISIASFTAIFGFAAITSLAPMGLVLAAANTASILELCTAGLNFVAQLVALIAAYLTVRAATGAIRSRQPERPPRRRIPEEDDD